MLLIHNASQLLTLAGGPQRGDTLGTLGIIPDGAVLVEDDLILSVGTSLDLLRQYPHVPRLDAAGKVVLPGFVDPHTHAVWAGDRAAEFEMRLQGKTYIQILTAGGGILSTVQATRACNLQELVRETRPRLHQAFIHGTTTMEVKTGYGLDLATELKQLRAILELNAEGPLTLVPTYLGAHAIPAEFAADPVGYTTFICDEALVEVKRWWQAQAPHSALPFVDVFCEKGAFNLAQTQRILARAKMLGFPLKIHVDEFENLGGTSLAVELGAVSADHLVKTSSSDIHALGASNTVAVSLPGTPFGLGQCDFSPAKQLLAANGVLALATDLNPGTIWCESMQFIIGLACRFMGLTPAQAIAASTINAAAAIQHHQLVGSLEAGKQADLLILSVDDYRHLGYRVGTNLVSYVIKKGVVTLVH